MATKTESQLDKIYSKIDVKPLTPDDIIEAKVIIIHKHEVWLDIGHYGVGLVSRRELVIGRKIEVGDVVSASVIAPETAAGHAILSLRRALQNKGWEEIQRLYDDNETVEVQPYDANKGGLLIEIDGVGGFLPLSHLSAKNYPKINNKVPKFNRDVILQKLHQLVGQKLQVCVIDFDRKTSKVIFSEKEAQKETIAKKIASLAVGDIVEGIVTAIVVPYGAFVNVDGIDGLVHISEISWERVEDPNKFLKIDQKIKVKIVSIDQERLSLSIRQLSEDPWVKESEDLKIGDEIEGRITRVTVFGAFVQISPIIEALIHVAEIKTGEEDENEVEDKAKDKKNENGRQKSRLSRAPNSEEIFKVGDKHKFTIVDIDRPGRKIALGMTLENYKPKSKTKKKPTKLDKKSE